ncbi:MAG: pyridoxamine 5'-phosphate oxidase family protein [Clostridiales Family XIII bacterium]|jgi:nitroimidazol reductase NimA-like FMN-containing flavoprotein (pyridoxamine 5'-phosphate oxidase superfamily)|nr:pyridoxamine 5'-phosphate oxidase family protein [Clostridiales Family XIII bacterium]
MRRHELEVREPAEIAGILDRCDVCRIGLSCGGAPYIVPMNFGYALGDDGSLTLFFHSSPEGRKMGMIGENPLAGFEADCSHRLVEGESACSYSMEYESVIGSGRIVLCEGRDEKIAALGRIMRKYAPHREFSFPDAALDAVAAFRLEVSEFSGKRLMKKA